MIISEKYDDYDLKNLILIKNKQRRNVEKTNEIEFSDRPKISIYKNVVFIFDSCRKGYREGCERCR